MKFWLLLFFCGWCTWVSAQQQTVEGLVFDKVTKERIAKVNVLNASSGKSVYNNLKGEFNIAAQPGDKLIFSRPDYKPDTITVKDYKPLAVYMATIAIQLRQVDVRDTALNPQKHLMQIKRDYSKIYRSLNSDNPMAFGPGGVGISIDAIWNALSREGRNAEHLRENIQRDYEQEVIDYRFSKTFVASVTKLTEPQLTDFMRKYRPGYYTVVNDNDYEFISYIKSSLRHYLRNPRGRSLQPLIRNN